MIPNDSFSEILKQHVAQMAKGAVGIAEGKEFLELTNVEDLVLINLAQRAKEIFAQEPILLNLSGPIVVVGDLHGHILDLYRILALFNLPPTSSYLFLGDLVDRGPFSLETVTLVFCLKVLYPNKIFCIRGNHEFEKTTMFGGFFQEISSTYINSSIFDAFIAAFDQMPLAALIGNSILCVHAGICPGLSSLSQISNIKRPIHTTDDSLVCGLTWSDPSEAVKEFAASRRGVGFYFGANPLYKFLDRNNLTTLVRGHECVSGTLYRFNSRCISIFSVSNYCGMVNNNSGVALVDEDLNITPYSLPVLRYLTRDRATIHKSGGGNLPLNQAGKLVMSQASFSLMSSVTGASRQQIAENGLRRRYKIGKILNPPPLKLKSMNSVDLAQLRTSQSLRTRQMSSVSLLGTNKTMSSISDFTAGKLPPKDSLITIHEKKEEEKKEDELDFLPSLKDLNL